MKHIKLILVFHFLDGQNVTNSTPGHGSNWRSVSVLLSRRARIPWFLRSLCNRLRMLNFRQMLAIFLDLSCKCTKMRCKCRVRGKNWRWRRFQRGCFFAFSKMYCNLTRFHIALRSFCYFTIFLVILPYSNHFQYCPCDRIFFILPKYLFYLRLGRESCRTRHLMT